jgi:acetoin utilization protein AcuC
MPDRANGFCYLNDPVLAILSLRANGAPRVAYVDVDAHHCDGVDHAFRDDPDVLLVSTHEERRWPFTGDVDDAGAGNVWNLPLPRGTDDTGMAMALDRLIVPVVADFAPDAIVLQCGADAVADDPLSRLALSNRALWRVVAALRPMSPRYLVLGGGGYNPWSVGRAWAGVWATLAGQDIPDRLPDAAESVLRALEWRGHSRGRRPPPHWFTTLADPPREGPIDPEVRARLGLLQRRRATSRRSIPGPKDLPRPRAAPRGGSTGHDHPPADA